MKTLFAGPFVGEFGWELYGWQARLRYLAVGFDRVIVASRPGRKALYSDFCDEFLAYDPGNLNSSEHFLKGFKDPHLETPYVKAPGDMHIPPNKRLVTYKPQWDLDKSFIDQKFVAYGKKGNYEPVDVVIHARTRIGWDTGSRNWDDSKWSKLIVGLLARDLKILCIGSIKESRSYPGTIDCRGKPLSEVVNILANAKLIAGPSSGPMHLASLCKCPQVVWSPEHNRIRYTLHWNPFKTKVTFILAENWQPSVTTVIDNILKELTG